MLREPVISFVALCLATIITVVVALNFMYLNHGMDLGVSIEGGPPTIFHIDFPIWRRIANMVVGMMALTCVWLFYIDYGRTLLATFVSLAATIILGWANLYQYGLGAPRSLWIIGALLALAIATRFRSKLKIATM